MHTLTLRAVVVPLTLFVGFAAFYLASSSTAPERAHASTADNKRLISHREAQEKVETYARVVCQRHGRCQGYSAAQCVRHDHGVSCKAHNFWRTLRGQRVSCGRLVFVHGEGQHAP